MDRDCNGDENFKTIWNASRKKRRWGDFSVYMTDFGVKSAGTVIFYAINNHLSLKHKVQ